MNARNVEVQQQLQEKDDEIKRLRRILGKVRRGEVHALGSRMRVYKSTAEVRLQISLPLI